MKKFLFLLFIISMFQFDLSGQDWNLRTNGDTVLVQNNKDWIPVSSKGMEDNLLKQVDKVSLAKKKVEAAQKELATLENQFKSFVRLSGLIATKEQEIANQKAIAARPPTKKEKKANKKKGKK